MKKQLYFINLFLTGAAGYCLLEILWRGYTHWAMGAGRRFVPYNNRRREHI